MTITTVACKMSVVFPVMVSIFYFHEKIILSKIAGIILALISIFLLIKKENTPQKKKKLFLMLLPIWLFIGLGTCDSLVKIVQQIYISKGEESLFTSSLFSFSLLAGLVYGIFTKDFFKKFLHLYTLLAGIFIGLANYGSMYFLICALNYSHIDSSIVFGLVNIGIIACSLFIGSLFFHEKMLLTNKIGIFIAFISIIFMTISQWHG